MRWTRFRRIPQAAALPWRRAEDGSIEVLLVTGRRNGRWIVPKGWPMLGRGLRRAGLREAAAREALEEAGVRGEAAETAIGTFSYRKTRFLLRLPFEVAVYPLRVEEECADWPEKGLRRRCWFGIEAAARLVRSKALARLIRSLPSHL